MHNRPRNENFRRPQRSGFTSRHQLSKATETRGRFYVCMTCVNLEGATIQHHYKRELNINNTKFNSVVSRRIKSRNLYFFPRLRFPKSPYGESEKEARHDKLQIFGILIDLRCQREGNKWRFHTILNLMIIKTENQYSICVLSSAECKIAAPRFHGLFNVCLLKPQPDDIL